MSEYLKKLEQEKNRLELSVKRSQLSDSSKQRKERTRRLIQKGALLEKYFDSEHLSIDETEELLKMFSPYVNEKKPEKFKRKRT
ncbi:hypothetical protein SC09_contig8orf00229 [Bacillus subtilis]|uniref:DUF3847 domain-containing protein n=1 Tax=Bacillus subtilis TaxID=1423 RepID=A0A0D1IX60_BACIU|nr:hypothetical protein SC09_contig8orf00229 [Bacillus subtilis]